jgi:hypothetical protein
VNGFRHGIIATPLMFARIDRIRLYEAMRPTLVVAALLIAAVSWFFGRSIGETKIFDVRHNALMLEYHAFETALGTEVEALCSTGSVRRIYFDTLDVGLTGILDATGRNVRCRVVRETPVTPLAVDSLAQCSAIIMKESHLSVVYKGVVRAELGPVAPQVSQIAQWRSAAGNFGFDVYRKSDCDPLPNRTSAVVGPTVARSSQ